MYVCIHLFIVTIFIIETYYEEMLESGVLEMKDDYDFKDEIHYSENKQNEKKKSKADVSFFFIKI